MSCGRCSSSGSCSSSCSKLITFDWLKDIQQPSGVEPYDTSEVAFKGTRRAFFKNGNVSPNKGDLVIVESDYGYDMGVISLSGETARLQVKKKIKINQSIKEKKKILRYPTQEEIEKWQDAQKQEPIIHREVNKEVEKMGLDMKISDVEFQAGKSKLYFYFTAEGRVDFRQLVINLAKQYKLKIEMKQIGARQEASVLGGIGVCGRELCCSTWLTDFRVVSNAAARYQQLSLNSEKLIGKCGKMKCCINYELEAYTEELKKFPSSNKKLKTKKGTAIFKKLDVFKGKVWYSYKEDPYNYIELNVDEANKIIELNKKEEIPEDLMIFKVDEGSEYEDSKAKHHDNILEQDSLTRFDRKKSAKRKKKNRKKTKPQNKP